MIDEEMISKLKDIQARRMEAFRSADTRDHKNWMTEVADSTTLEDIQTIQVAYEMLDELGKLTMDLSESLAREWTQGIRCSVCGHTTKQSLALGYDCMYDC